MLTCSQLIQSIGLAAATTLLVSGCSAQSTAAGDLGASPQAASAATPARANSAATVAQPAQAYVDAVNDNDLEALVSAFAPDGRVVDVSRVIAGRDAIRTWADNEVMGGRLEVLEVVPMDGGQDLLVHWAPAGSAGWRAHYRFTMTDSQITTADLQYA